MAERKKPAGYGTGEYEEKRSRFIGELFPVTSEEEAKSLVTAARKKYPDARHHCWAWVLPDGSFRWSDDGEPGGTAGMPIIEVMKARMVTNCAVVVTRYFGGTLLGTGGLVRAYTDAVKTGLGNCEIVTETEGKRLEIRLGYTEHAKIQNYFKDCGQEIEDTAYGEDVRLTILVETGSAKERVDAVVDKTSGKAVIKDLGECVFLKKSLR